MPLSDPLDHELFAALAPLRPDPDAFRAAVLERVEEGGAGAAEGSGDEQEERRPRRDTPLLRAAASVVPLPLLVGGKLVLGSAKAGPTSVGAKLVGYAALPAISVFLMLGAFVFSALRLRGATVSEGGDEAAIQAALRQWWRRHWWVALPCYGFVAVFPFVGDVAGIFTVLVLSSVALALLLATLAKRGFATRQVIANTCTLGLLLLALCAGAPNAGKASIHFVDQKAVMLVLYLGVVLVSFIGILGARLRVVLATSAGYLPMLALLIWMTIPLFRHTTEADIQQYVESFDKAEFGSATWRGWSLPARWVKDRFPHMDWTKPRALLERSIAQRVSPFVLNHATRVGILETGNEALVSKTESRRRRFLHPRTRTHPFGGTSEQSEWALRLLLAEEQVTQDDLDHITARIQVTLDELAPDDHGALATLYLEFELLAALGQALDLDAWRPRVFEFLHACFSTQAGGFNAAGGFQEYDRDRWGSYEGTWYAVQLMKRFGMPPEIDPNWIRSFCRTAIRWPWVSTVRDGTRRSDARHWIAEVTRRELEALPSVAPVTWKQWLFHERTLVAACLLVLFCLFATLRAPKTVGAPS